ncbi:hypothetical protein I7O18_00785, partial [Neisseria meningitidis]|nr:hypothetical protein [Neisseria meningitidis]
KSEGRLLTAGPNPLPEDSNRVSGSLIVAQFESLDAAEAWAEGGQAKVRAALKASGQL